MFYLKEIKSEIVDLYYQSFIFNSKYKSYFCDQFHDFYIFLCSLWT
jgi:hypothetical protein